jgi:hypothetical protein
MTDLPTIDDRLEALERETATLRAENLALRSKLTELADGGLRRKIPEPREPVTRVISPVAQIKADLPPAAELQRLRDICALEYPAWTDSSGYVWAGRLGPDPGACEAEWLKQFSASILAITNMRVLEKPDHKRYVSAHTDAAEAILRSIGKPVSELRGAPFIMAALAMGIPTSGMGIMGSSVSLGLAEHVGKPANPSAWRAVLRAGRLPAQFAVERRIESAPSAVRIDVIRPTVA